MKLDVIFNALSDENRIRIISIIKENDKVCACDILEKLSITQPTLAYHMKILQDAKIVSCKKKGKWCVYKIENNQLHKSLDFINNIVEEKE